MPRNGPPNWRVPWGPSCGSQLSPRAYAVWDISTAWTLKGGVSTGFKTPKTTDLYDGIIGFGGQGTIPFVGNPDLTPETSVNSEVALYWTSADALHNFNITAFHNDFDDKIARGETNLNCAQTGGVRPCALHRAPGSSPPRTTTPVRSARSPASVRGRTSPAPRPPPLPPTPASGSRTP